MKSEDSADWRHIEEMFHQAWALPAEQRMEFLRRASAADARLFDEVQSLLLAAEQAFALERGIAIGQGHSIAAATLDVSTLLGAYRIRRLLDQDGDPARQASVD